MPYQPMPSVGRGADLLVPAVQSALEAVRVVQSVQRGARGLRAACVEAGVGREGVRGVRDGHYLADLRHEGFRDADRPQETQEAGQGAPGEAVQEQEERAVAPEEAAGGEGGAVEAGREEENTEEAQGHCVEEEHKR